MTRFNVHMLCLMLLAFCYCTNTVEKGGEKTEADLDLPASGFEFQLYQRKQIELPSKNGKIICAINDITAGQTVLTIRSASKKILEKSIRRGEGLNFELNNVYYVVKCTQLMNKLVGEDYGNFFLTTFKIETDTNNRINPITPDSESVKIDSLITRIENADIRFIRNGIEYSPQEAAAHLRTKWEKAGNQIKTLNDFIEYIASKSSMSGEPYLVRFKNGKVIKAIDWYSNVE